MDVDINKQMEVDFADSSKRLNKEQWNYKHFRAENKIKYASQRQIIHDTETNDNIKIYLKGKLIESTPKHITWLSKYKLIHMIMKEYGNITYVSYLKRTSRKKLLNMLK